MIAGIIQKTNMGGSNFQYILMHLLDMVFMDIQMMLNIQRVLLQLLVVEMLGMQNIERRNLMPLSDCLY